MRVSNALLIWDQHPEITQRSFSHHLDVLLSLCFTVINLEEDHASHFTLQHNSKVSHHCQAVSTVCTGVSYGRHCDPWIGDDMCAGPSVSYDSVKPLKRWLISISCPLDSLQHKLWCCMCHQIGNWKKTLGIFRWGDKSSRTLLNCPSQKAPCSCLAQLQTESWSVISPSMKRQRLMSQN